MGSKKWKRIVLWTVSLAITALITGLVIAYWDHQMVFNPKGPVAEVQKNLIVISLILCAIVVIPVIILLAFIVKRYRDTPDNDAPYQPEWNDSKVLETVWWGIPVLIIGVLAFFTARDTYVLAKPRDKADVKPITIQVTSLDWKWFFQYPDQKIATVNYVEIPADVPVRFVLTSDAPMNSFWVPELGGQTYSMPGMAMQLYLQADDPGIYYGTGANFSGKDFAHMRFEVVAKPQAEFDGWVQKVKDSSPALTREGYAELTKPGTSEVAYFSSYPTEVFDETVQKNGGGYMSHGGNPHADPGSGHSDNVPDTGKTGGMDHDMSGMDMNMDMSGSHE